jgi:hypothetical protein
MSEGAVNRPEAIVEASDGVDALRSGERGVAGDPEESGTPEESGAEEPGTSDRRRRFLRAGARSGAHAAAWALVNAATGRAAAQTVEALRVEKVAQRVASRYPNATLPQLAGRMFEVMHELSFNHDAIAKGSKIRATTTEWVTGGSQSAAADLHLRDEGGRLLAQAQAKVMGDTVRAARSIVNGRYEGMQRLIPGDQLEAVKTSRPRPPHGGGPDRDDPCSVCLTGAGG